MAFRTYANVVQGTILPQQPERLIGRRVDDFTIDGQAAIVPNRTPVLRQA